MMFDFKANGLSFGDTDSGFAVNGLGMRLMVEGDRHEVAYTEIANNDGGVATASGRAGVLEVRSRVEQIPGLNAVVLRHTLINPEARPVWVNAAATGQFAEDAGIMAHGTGGAGWDLRFCHTDNVRTDRFPHCQPEYPYVRMLPIEKRRLGAGEDQAFPALFCKDVKTGAGIVFAAASQALNFTVFDIRKAALVGNGIFEEFAILHDPGQSSGFQIPAGGKREPDGVFIQLNSNVAYQDAFTDYIDWLAPRFRFLGPDNPLLREAFHCTWNYGVFADQTEKSLMPTARFIAGNVPNIKWFLMDAGYLTGTGGSTFLERFYPDPNQLVSVESWPCGIRGYTDELRRLGLRPGIWWSPTVDVPSALYDDHPDWFLRNADGSLYLIGGQRGFLDYSNPEALDFLDRTLAVILGEWGMDACKMDFWSQNFEDRDIRLSDPTVTAVQVRTRFFETVRKHLPEDGVFMTCIATGMGDPFIGQWADTYRNTIDIGEGDWEKQIINCIWALPTLGFEGRKTFLLNNDSVGIAPDLPDNENQFRFTWMFMNMGLQETGGRMETWPEKWVKAMRKFTDRCDRGYRVKCPDDRAFTGVPLPEVLYVDYPADSPTAQSGVCQSVALFNWTDEPKTVSVLRSHLGHSGPVQAEDFWTDEQEPWDGEFISRRLAPRSALLFDVLA